MDLPVRKVFIIVKYELEEISSYLFCLVNEADHWGWGGGERVEGVGGPTAQSSVAGQLRGVVVEREGLGEI